MSKTALGSEVMLFMCSAIFGANGGYYSNILGITTGLVVWSFIYPPPPRVSQYSIVSLQHTIDKYIYCHRSVLTTCDIWFTTRHAEG